MNTSTVTAGATDKIILYASIFLYQPKLRMQYVNYKASIKSFEANNMLPPGSDQMFTRFIEMNDDQQRQEIADKNKAEDYIRLFFEIVKKVKGNDELITYALLVIDGILEDNRSRIQYLVSIQKTHKKDKFLDLIGILNSFLYQSNAKSNEQRDLASHILAMLIEAVEYKNCMQEARQFMNWLLEQKDPRSRLVSLHTYTFCLMYLLKTNELAKEFVDHNGFELYSQFLDKECLDDHQIAYNVCCALWIISYHQFAMKGFEDFRFMIIEKVARILDYFNKEKIVRIILLVFDNIKTNEVCLELLSDINALNILTKLQNRHWVDKDITDLLDKLYEYIDQNYKVFSSIEKFKKEVGKRVFKWGPVHSEKFWQENCFHFHEKENLDLIKILVQMVEPNNDIDDRTKAICCFDLGEFARFFAFGRQILEQLVLKEKIIQLMGMKTSSAELKKEAITCYQKLLMNSWQGDSK